MKNVITFVVADSGLIKPVLSSAGFNQLNQTTVYSDLSRLTLKCHYNYALTSLDRSSIFNLFCVDALIL